MLLYDYARYFYNHARVSTGYITIQLSAVYLGVKKHLII